MSLSPSHYRQIPINDEDSEEELPLNLSEEDAHDLRGGMYEYSRSHIDSRSYSHSVSSPPDIAIDYEYHSHDQHGKSLSPRSMINSPQNDNDTITSMGHHNGDSYDSDEEDLGKYSFDFNQTVGRSGGHFKNGYEQTAGTRRLPSHFHFDREDSNIRWKSSPVRKLYHRIQDARMDTRRKRLERLLALPDETTMKFHRERCALFFGTWCDLLDKGFIPILFMLVIYVVVLSTLDDEHAFVKKIMLGFGIPIFIFRISWRPLCWFVRERRQELRKRKMTLDIVELPPTSSSIEEEDSFPPTTIQII